MALLKGELAKSKILTEGLMNTKIHIAFCEYTQNICSILFYSVSIAVINNNILEMVMFEVVFNITYINI